MVCREVYTNYYIPSSKINTPENVYYSTILKYPEEDVDGFLSRYEDTLEEYLRFDVKKYFGLTINEYLDLTFKEKEKILKACISETKRLLEAAKTAKENSDNEIKQMKSNMLGQPPPKPKPTTQPIQQAPVIPTGLAGLDLEDLM